MKTLLLIDANALIHRAFHALPPMSGKDGKGVNALYGLSSILLKIWREERPDFAAALFDRPEPTFRKQEYAEYKSHRPKAADELIHQIIGSHELFDAFKIKTFELPGFEADDLIGTLSARFQKEDLRVVILTGDLDALQLVVDGRVVVKTLKTGVSKTFVYDKEAVEERYGLPPEKLTDYKALVGDPSDNIPGVPGVGPKTATSLLLKYGSLEGIYENLDKEIKLKEKFQNKKEDVFLYRKLSMIRKDAPVVIDELEKLATEDIAESVITYFENIGFESLKQRAEENGRASSKPAKEAAAELFPLNIPPNNKKALTNKEVKDVVFLKLQDDPGSIARELASLKTKAGFNLKVFVKEARKKGAVLKEPFFDFGVGFWLLDPDSKNSDPAVFFKRFLKQDFTGSAADFANAYLFLKKEIERRGLSKVFYKIEMPLLPVLAEMEESGIAVYKSRLQSLLEKINKEVQSLQDKIHELAGHKININSPKQLSELIFEKLKIGLPKSKKTATGLKSTREEVLSELKGKHPIIDALLRYREIFKLKSTYIEPVLNLTGEDGRLRTTYIQTGTATGRLSSQSPNLQNIPTGYNLAQEFRSAFVAKDGFSLIAFDYSQIELRVLASVSEDEKMIQAFKAGEDIHALTAAAIFKVPKGGVTPEVRRLAKTLNFGIVYGMGVTAFAKNTGLKRDEAKQFIENYFKEFKQIKVWQEKTKEEARRVGFVKNENGRIRNVAALKFGAFRALSDAERVTTNMPIQSLGADIIKLAMITVSEKIKSNFKNREVKMLLTIHDELLFEVRDDMIKEASELIKEIMCSVYKLKVPLAVNIKLGKNWGELH